MLAGFSASDLSDPKALLGIVVALIIVGGLIPRRMHQSMLSLKDDTIADLRRQNAELLAQNSKLIGAAELGLHIAEDFHKTVNEPALPSGGDDHGRDVG